MLRKLRIAAGAILLAAVTWYFVDFAGILPDGLGVLARIQFFPAFFMHSVAILMGIVALTLLFGRLYCSVICPMGVFQDVVSRVAGFFRKKKKRYKYSPARNVLRYGLLAGVAVVGLAGFSFLVSLLDPYAAYGRIAANVFSPVYLAGNNLLETIFTSFGNYTFYRMEVPVRSILSLAVALVTLGGVGYLAWRFGRAYCNTVCPVGAILGLLSRYSLFKVRIDTAKCNGCGVCASRCKSSCIDSKNHRIDHSRCVDCFNCLDACRQSALSFSLPPGKKAKIEIPEKQPDTARRKFIATSLAATITVPALVAGGRRNRFRQHQGENKAGYGRSVPISPPGSLGHAHLERHCTACHLCISKCPSKVLKPAFTQYGLAGMMQPMMDFEKGFCNFDCTVCSDVCPNGAILPLTQEEKHLTQVGKVVFLKRFCIVHTDGTSCGACSEHCPTQAVSMVPYRDGLTIPHTDPSICVGCGGCEYVCPATPHKAIYVEGNAVHEKAVPFRDVQAHEEEIDDFGF